MTDTWTTHSLQQGSMELKLLPGIGGRLWDVVFEGQSLLFQNPDLDGIAFKLDGLTGLPTRSPQFAFPLWGGEKTWIAPDSAWVGGGPFPALDSGPYSLTRPDASTAMMESGICPDTSLSVTRRIKLQSGMSWTIEHNVTNHGPNLRLTGIWSVLMLDHPTRIGVATADTTIAPVFGDAGTLVAPAGPGIVCACDGKQEFKVGLPNPDGRMLIGCADGAIWMTCRTAIDDVASYANGHPVEVFNSGDYAYCEAEWHSPAKTLMPGETMTFLQTFSIWAAARSGEVDLSQTDKELMTCMY